MKQQPEYFQHLILHYTFDDYTKVIFASDIESFIYGGFSSRFWILRKEINDSNTSKFVDETKLCWNMISVKLKDNGLYLDLIIKNQKHMNIFLQFLLQ